jgi:lipopolysaccharide export system protein LptC
MRFKSNILLSSYRRLINLSKILSFLGILLIIYLVYINLKSINISSELNEDYSQHDSLNLYDKSNYNIKILNSTFTGVNKKLNPYQVEVIKAIKTLDNVYELDEIKATYKMNDDKKLIINAKYGLLNEGTQILKLQNEVKFILGDNTLKTQTAEMNLLTQELLSKSGVLLSYKNSKITSNIFSSKDNNEIINFKGSVSTIINISDFQSD